MEKKSLLERLIFSCIRPGDKDPYYVVCPRCKAETTAEVVSPVRTSEDSMHCWKMDCASCGFIKVGNFGFMDELFSVVAFYSFIIVLSIGAYVFFPEAVVSSPALLIVLFALCVFVIGGTIHLLCVQKIIERGLAVEDRGPRDV